MIPFCGSDGTEIDTKEIRHCYFCGSPMEPFIYPKENKPIVTKSIPRG
jgi:hypothetical protein